MTLLQRIILVLQSIGIDIKSLNTNKQDLLISGTNIKTVNGNSLIGSGNIVISGSGLSFKESLKLSRR